MPDLEPDSPSPAVGYLPAVGEGTPCEWPIIPQENSHVDAPAYYDMAVDYLWRWTNTIFGLCEVVVRPCREDCLDPTVFWGGGPYTGGHFAPVSIRGRTYYLTCRSCGTRRCSCDEIDGIALPGPVSEVTKVLLDGVEVDPSLYKVLNRRHLVRTDGQAWPTCQDVTRDSTEEGTFEVTYLRGVAVPQGGQIAAGLLANEFAKAAANDSSCQLPKRLQTVTRQGVTVAMIDSFENVDKGFTGIWLIDAWVNGIVKSPRPSRVMSPDYRYKG